MHKVKIKSHLISINLKETLIKNVMHAGKRPDAQSRVEVYKLTTIHFSFCSSTTTERWKIQTSNLLVKSMSCDKVGNNRIKLLREIKVKL